MTRIPLIRGDQRSEVRGRRLEVRGWRIRISRAALWSAATWRRFSQTSTIRRCGTNEHEWLRRVNSLNRSTVEANQGSTTDDTNFAQNEQDFQNRGNGSSEIEGKVAR